MSQDSIGNDERLVDSNMYLSSKALIDNNISTVLEDRGINSKYKNIIDTFCGDGIIILTDGPIGHKLAYFLYFYLLNTILQASNKTFEPNVYTIILKGSMWQEFYASILDRINDVVTNDNLMSAYFVNSVVINSKREYLGLTKEVTSLNNATPSGKIECNNIEFCKIREELGWRQLTGYYELGFFSFSIEYTSILKNKKTKCTEIRIDVGSMLCSDIYSYVIINGKKSTVVSFKNGVFIEKNVYDDWARACQIIKDVLSLLHADINI